MAEFDKGNKFRRWENALDSPERALKQIGALMVAESQLAFREQRFGDTPWPPRSDVNVFGIIADFAAGLESPPARRLQTRPALVDTGRLSASISFRLDTPRSVIVGSNLPYSGVHQEGGEVESEVITKDVQVRLRDWLRGQSKKVRDRMRFALSPSMEGQRIKAEVPKRPFVGITKQTIKDIRDTIGLEIFGDS